MKVLRQIIFPFLLGLFSINAYGQNSKSQLLTFTSKTKDYFVKVDLQYADTILLNFTLTGKCKKKYDFVVAGHPQKIGTTINISLPDGKSYNTTQYLINSGAYSIVFEISDTNTPAIRLMGVSFKGDKKCEDCIKAIRTGQMIKPMEVDSH